MKRALIPAVLAVLAAVPASAQETIASDRPGIGSGAFVLEGGRVQLEAGLELARAADADLYNLGQLLVRLGIPGPVELQLLGSSFTLVRGGDVETEGLQDLGVGAKLRLLDGEGPLSVSALAVLTFPTGDDAFTSDETVPSLTLLADLGVSETATLSANVGYSAGVGAVEEELSVILTPGVSVGESAGLYGGYAGFFGGSDDLHFAEGGVTWLPGPDLQLDLNGGVEMDSGDYFLGAGVAVRWPQR